MRLWVLALLGLVCFGLAKHVDLPPPYEDHCIIDDGPSGSKYDPTGQFRFPWFDVNLDEPPSVRWQKVSVAYAARIKGLIDALMNFAEQLFPGATIFVDTFCDELADRLQQPYRDEIISVSKDTGIGLGRIVLYNIFYEVFTVCTSIVATDSSGNTIHARNLDFGLFLGWNASNHDWIISDHLRQIIVNVNWIKDGKVLYKSNHFAGYIGVYNAMKRDAFSITTNSRFMAVGGIDGIIRWMLGLEANGKWMSWLIRETMEFGTDYEDAKDRLMNIPMLSPVYYVLGGSKPYQGAIITRALDSADYLVEMDPNKPNGWYVLQTNYDDDDPSEILYLDDRDTPGRACMNKLGQANVNFEGLYNVLSSRTNLNKLTTYTVLMSTQTGAFETHLQGCPGLCWPV